MMKKLIILFVLGIFILSSAQAVTMRTQQTTTLPAYRFQSTSTCPSVVGNSAYTTTTVFTPYGASPSGGGPRRTGSWDDPGGDGYAWDEPDENDYPGGVLPNPAPVGEPLVLLVMALLYIAWRCRKRATVLCLLVLMTVTAHAQINAITGDWTTVDDKTGEKRSVVTIYKGTDDLYYGKISRLLIDAPGLKCDQCKDEDYNAPLEGLVIIRGMQFDAQANALTGGKVLDPENGKFYYGKIYPKNGRLVLRGSLDKRGFFGRNQEWER